MLESIHIENIALIEKLDISFSGGFSAFTGETGAGKSIIIDSIGVICGNRASKELIRAGCDYALCEAVFSDLSKQTLARLSELGIDTDEDGYLYISRRITDDGKSVCRVNSRQIPASLLREMSAFLINIHGQHDNQDLLKKDKHISILDTYTGSDINYQKYTALYTEYKKLKKELSEITTDDTEKQRTIEMFKFQIEEISSLKLKPNEEEELVAEKKRLSNIEKIAENSAIAYGALFADNMSAVENIDRAISCINNLAKMTDGMDEYIESLEKSRAEIYDVAEYIHDFADIADDNPSARLDRIEKRLYDIYKLKRKYGPDVPAILEYLDSANQKLSGLELSDITKEEIQKKLEDVEKRLNITALALSKERTESGEKLKKEIEQEFLFLEMPKVKFSVDINKKDFSADGIDDIEFLIQTNAGLPYSSLCKTASGGELSRIMLAIKSVIAKKDGVETVIYDEVDTGISGKTSRRIGIKLLSTSTHSQVMCVTHSAQIASLANSHYKVSKFENKGTTFTTVQLLDNNERIDETARIISGINITENARNAALELIEESKKY